MSVLIETTLGDIVVDLYTDDAPQATKNFLKLCKTKYYNFCIFHRVEKNFIAQTGDPTGTGKGGESIYKILNDSKNHFPSEITPRLNHKKRGTVSMPSVLGSQFFITLGDDLDYLNGKHTVFGEVAEGAEILEKLNEAICDEDTHRPLKDIRIMHTIILDDPFTDPSDLEVPDRSPSPTTEQINEMIEDFSGTNAEETEQSRRDREAKAQALTLEMIGDLPFADVKPPENILFVCKLNPATRSEDLETIFARFGKIHSCDVVRDKATGDSLGYAFIEFDEKEACEEAYFKMDNVLIDDRRIHVDFSQSVSGLHGSWVRSKVEARGVAGNTGLRYRKRYRGDGGAGKSGSDSYDMVFDTGSKPKNIDKPERQGRRHNRKSSRSPRRPSDSRRSHNQSETSRDREPPAYKKSFKRQSRWS